MSKADFGSLMKQAFLSYMLTSHRPLLMERLENEVDKICKDDLALEVEYKLIQEKRSKLSANQRRMIIAVYETRKTKKEEK